MPDFNYGDFTQQGIENKVTLKARLNERRYVTLDLQSDVEGPNLTISGNVHDELNNIDYPIGSAPSGNIEITENGENINVAPYATATVNVAGGGGGLPTCEITMVPQEGGSSFDGYNAESPNYCLDTNGKLMATIADYQTNLVVNGLYKATGGGTIITYTNLNSYATEADAIASVTNKVNITVFTYEDSGRYHVVIMPTDDSLPSSCTMEGNGK